jgi:chromosome segregation ATPase
MAMGMMNYLIKSALMLLIISIDSPSVYAQETKSQINIFNPETRKNYEDTQKLINKTRTKLDLVRTQNNARAREIEALTNKVGAIITRMSGQGKDNTALQSEISVLDEMLTIERNATDDLRTKNIKLLNKIDAIRIQNFSLENRHTEIVNKYETDLIETKKRLKNQSADVANGVTLNKQLESNIETLATEVVRLRNQIKLLKKNRYRSKLGAK